MKHVQFLANYNVLAADKNKSSHHLYIIEQVLNGTMIRPNIFIPVRQIKAICND
jgi:hypothetical protein